jgi:SpoVK/Ycf46/Vps4 family AAA+-type ATPase
MDKETLEALIAVYRAHGSTDLLSIIIDEAEGVEAAASVLDLLRSIDEAALASPRFASARRKACSFALKSQDFTLAERMARGSDLAEDKALLARALHGLGRESEAHALYREAIAQDPAIRSRDMERLLGIRPGTTTTPQPAKIISLTSYSSRREGRGDSERREPPFDLFGEEFEESSVTFADVAGLDALKAEIRRRIVLPYLKPSLFERYKRKPGGNLLMYGPPGCGKTLIARATAGECDARFLTVSPADIFDRFAGEAEKRLRAFFDEARSETPAILFFDDLDVLGQRRRPGTGELMTGLLSAILGEIEGAHRANNGVLILAATNAPWLLEPGFFRAGRFSRSIYVGPPDAKAREYLLGRLLRGLPGAERLHVQKLARRMPGFSGADVCQIVEHVCDLAVERSILAQESVTLTQAMFEEVLRGQVATTPQWVRIARTELRALEGVDGFSPLVLQIDRNKLSIL